MLEARHLSKAHRLLAAEIRDKARVVLLGARWHYEEAQRQIDIATRLALEVGRKLDEERASGTTVSMEEEIRKVLESERE
jgi:hypothetical protein